MWNSSGSSSNSSSKKSKRKSGSTSGSDVNETRVEKMFEEFAEEDDPAAMGMDGIIKLCEHLDLDPFEDKRVLVLLWKLGSKEKPAQISKEEFMSGCFKLHIDSIEKIQALVPSLDTGFLDEVEFKDFYKVCHALTDLCFCCVGLQSIVRLNLFSSFFDPTTVLLSVQSAGHSPDIGQGVGCCTVENDIGRANSR